MPTPAQTRFRRPRAIVFDLDGTLVDSALDLAATLNRQLVAYGRPIIDLADVRMMIGEGAARLVERGFTRTGGLPGPLDALTTEFLADYAKAVAVHTRPFPHVVESLDRFSAAGIALGVCTNKAHALTRQLLVELGLYDRFAAVAGGDHPDLKGVRKPDPGHVMHVLERMGVPSQDAIFVGDSKTDVETARNAHLPVIVVTFGYTAIPAAELGADAVIDCFSELAELIQA